MSEICRELTVRELIEQSDCKNKEVVLSRLKAEDNRTCQRIDALEEELNHHIALTNAYRIVIKDIVRHVLG